ncbi:hypothetical protein [Streptomyces sp. NPDC000880]
MRRGLGRRAAVAAQLGLGDNLNRTSPAQVGTATNWSSVTAGSSHTCATRTTGALWCWGLSDKGQLGLGNTTNRTTPTQIPAFQSKATTGSQAQHTFAVA